MTLMNGFVTLELKFVNNFEVNADNICIAGVSFHILQI
jgi:hypothetical protein